MTFEPRHEKTNIFICENKDTDQLRSNNTCKEQNSSTFYSQHFQTLAIFCARTAYLCRTCLETRDIVSFFVTRLEYQQLIRPGIFLSAAENIL